jgi:hypothetical protein
LWWPGGFFSGILTGLDARIKFDKTLLFGGWSIVRKRLDVNVIIVKDEGYH